MTRNDLVAFCQSKGIVLEAWAPLVRGMRFKHPVVVELAEKYGKSPAQVLIRYGLDRVRLPRFLVVPESVGVLTWAASEQGFIVIPKSTQKARIVDNARVFDFTLEQADVDRLTGLDCFLVSDWEVTTVE